MLETRVVHSRITFTPRAKWRVLSRVGLSGIQRSTSVAGRMGRRLRHRWARPPSAAGRPKCGHTNHRRVLLLWLQMLQKEELLIPSHIVHSRSHHTTGAASARWSLHTLKRGGTVRAAQRIDVSGAFVFGGGAVRRIRSSLRPREPPNGRLAPTEP